MNADSWCWLLLLVAAAGRCCWSLLLVAAAGRCCWLLLLIAAAGRCCWLLLLLIAAADCCCWLLSLVAAAGKVFHYVRDISGLRLRQFCRRKSPWIFSGADDLRACCWKRSEEIFWIFKWELWVGEFRLREVGLLLVASEWIIWLCNGYLHFFGCVLFQIWWEPIGSFGEKSRASRLVL